MSRLRAFEDGGLKSGCQKIELKDGQHARMAHLLLTGEFAQAFVLAFFELPYWHETTRFYNGGVSSGFFNRFQMQLLDVVVTSLFYH